jgi:uncharacterized membrane protein
MTAEQEPNSDERPFRPIRTAIFRGLGVLAPPLLTIVIFFWVGGIVQQYVFTPVTVVAREVIVWWIADIRPADDEPDEKPVRLTKLIDGQRYRRIEGEHTAHYIPQSVYDFVRTHRRVDSMPRLPKDIYRRYVELRSLQPYQVIPFFLCGFLLVLYLLGKFITGGVGRFFWAGIEHGITRVPLVRNVYSSVKQVSDFLLSERNIEYSRVVAIEWPRRGVWCLALVTGPSLKDIEAAANEEVLSVLVCTSPMPMTGFTVTVRKSEAIDLNITIDQAIQFIVSCGVVVPPDEFDKLHASRLPVPLPASNESANDSDDE